MTPDPEYLFMTKAHREALLGMFNAIERRKGLVVFTGEAGTGKTTLVRKVMASIPAAKAKFSLVLNPALAQAQFVESMLIDFGIAEARPGEELGLAQLQQVLLQLHAEGKAAVLVVDEADDLSAEQLEQIRLLTNLEVPEAKLLQVILAGRKKLDCLLDQDSTQELKQRVAVRLTLRPLSSLEVSGYVEYRWCKEGTKTKHPFSEDALRGIARFSHGVPGLVEEICDNALQFAHADGAALVGEKQVLAAAKDLQLLASSTSEAASGEVVPPSAAEHQMSIPTPERAAVLSLLEGTEDRRGLQGGGAPPAQKPSSVTNDKTVNRVLPERRRASRSQIPDLFVYHWSGGVSPAHKVLDISEIGACFETKDRWPVGTMIELTLQRMPDGHPADKTTSLRLTSKVMRSSPGRLGVIFIYKQRQELKLVRKFLALAMAA